MWLRAVELQVLPVDESNTTPTGPFVMRLAAALFLGFSILTGLFAGLFAFERAPRMKMIVDDFGIDPGPSADWALSNPWVPLVIAIGAVIAGTGAVASTQRKWLVLSGISVLTAVVVTAGFELVSRGPLETLKESLTQ